MAYPHQINSLLDGMIAGMCTTSAAQAQQYIAAWCQMCKDIMRLPENRDKSDWTFKCVADVIKTGQDVETGATLYAMLVAQGADDAENDIFVIEDSANGSRTFDGTAALANTDRIAISLPAATTDLTEEYYPYLFPKGISFTNHMTVCADGEDGTDTAAAEIRAWLLYRTTVSMAH